jgi:two-component system chemotaxis response regulator CheB
MAQTQVPVLAIVLTGMGHDGASGMRDLYRRGQCFNIAQSEESCVVFGMPQEAIKLRAVHFVGALEPIQRKVKQFVQRYAESYASQRKKNVV